MSCFGFYKSALAVLLLFRSQFVAQAQTISSSIPGSAETTEIVGVTSTQTARLNVLNLQPIIIPGVTAVLCPATLEFYDETGHAVEAARRDQHLACDSGFTGIQAPGSINGGQCAGANPRRGLHAVTRVVNPGSEPPVTPIIPVSIGCSVMPSLEIIDDSTGDTHTFTTDMRTMSAYRILPLLGAARGR